MIDVRFCFHGPFHVLTGLPGDGRDGVIDPNDPLPRSHLKGLMRNEAGRLGLPERWVREVYGWARQPCPWAWSTPELDDVDTVDRHRVHMDPATGTALERGLLLNEEVWARRASFAIEPLVHLAEDRRVDHELVLMASAMSLTSVGADRNRGFGWISVEVLRSTGPGLSDSEITRLDSLCGEVA